MRYDRRTDRSNPSRDLTIFLLGGWVFLVLRLLTKQL